MTKAVFCIALSENQAQTITSRLRESGFPPSDISVLFPDLSGTHDFAHEQHTKAPEGTVAGVGTGGALGGALGWMVGIGALAIPGIGPFIAAGPIMALLAGAAVGATVGGVTGALIGLGIPEYEAKLYEGKIKSGNILISVHTDNGDEIERAKRIFRELNAQDIASTGEASVQAAAGGGRSDSRRSSTEINISPVSPADPNRPNRIRSSTDIV